MRRKSEHQPTMCPSCKNSDDRDVTLNTQLIERRMCRKVCPECGWVGEAFAPPKKPVKTTKVRTYSDGGIWVYETFDQYGQI